MSRCVKAQIHLPALRHNLARVSALAPHSRVMAVVKADGYGHGLERVALALQAADAFGVASIADGERLRAVGLKNRIVVLSGIDALEDLAAMRALTLEAVIHHPMQLTWLEQDTGMFPLRVWLKVDTGMHRLGFAPEQALVAYKRLQAAPQVHHEINWMTHFANSDVFTDDYTINQIHLFKKTLQLVNAKQSLANSAALVGFQQSHADWVRVGGLLYGLSVVAGQTGLDFGFYPAMTLSARLIAINQVTKGEYVGYGHTWQCPEDMLVGVVAIGYGDGYPRQVSSAAHVQLQGRPAPIIGRVSMDLLTIDLRSHPSASIGDAVILWGSDTLPVETVASWAGTIAYDLVCGMTRRVTFVEDEITNETTSASEAHHGQS